jgi:hypothetical protein
LDSGLGETKACNFLGEQNTERFDVGSIVGCRVLDQPRELGGCIPESGIFKEDPRNKIRCLDTRMLVQFPGIKEDI